MGLLQGIFAYLRKSASKILQAIFGWAVQALFGTPKEGEKTLLNVVVGAAAVWPLLLFGVLFPKIAALVLAFVPIPKWVPSSIVRIVWIVAAAAVPGAVGMALATRGDPEGAPGPFWRRFLDGFPVTVAIAAAFLVAFVTSPIRRAISVWKRWEDAHVTLIVEKDDYERVTRDVRDALANGGFRTEKADPPWLMVAPTRVLRALGGRRFRKRLPARPDFFVSPDLQLVVNPNGVTLRGTAENVARARGLVDERATFTPGIQTTDPAAERLERELKDVGAVYASDPAAHRRSAVLLDRVDEIARDLAATYVPYEQWQIVYRQILQVSRAVRGRPQLLELSEEEDMSPDSRGSKAADERPPSNRLRHLPTPALVSSIGREIHHLVSQEVELAKTELRADLERELAMVKFMAVAVVAALCGLSLLFVAAAMALGTTIPEWGAALVVGGILIAAAVVLGLVGWKRKVRPLETTRKTLKEDWEWAKNRVA